MYHGVDLKRQTQAENIPMKTPPKIFCALPAFVMLWGVLAWAGNARDGDSGLRSTMPAGYEVLVLKPSGATLSILGLVECSEIEGARQVSQGVHARLVRADGAPIEKFPHRFSFRITASLRKGLLDARAIPVDAPGDPRAFLLGLKFRVRVYRGLETHEITPESIVMIGVPADVPYDERVYRITIKAGDLPISDRFIIEVDSPQGMVLTHFPFVVL